MSGHILAILDSPDYVNLFLAFFANLPNLPFRVCGFTEEPALENFISENSIDILLLPHNQKFTEKNHISEKREPKKIVYMGDVQNPEADPPVLCRYRSMKQLSNDLLNIFREISGDDETHSPSGVSVYSIYTLEGTGSGTDAALALAEGLSAGGPLLYINLDRFSGIDLKLDLHPDYDISDLIYYYRTDEKSMRRVLDGAVCRTSGISIICPPVAPEDLNEIPVSKWRSFLMLLGNLGNYKTILLDIADSFHNLTLLFSLSEKVFIRGESFLPGAKDPRGEAFRRYFESSGRTDILSKMTPLSGYESHGTY